MRRDHPLAAEIETPQALPFAAHEVISALEPLLTDARRARIDVVIAQRTRGVVPVLDGLCDPHNVAAVLRSADSFGAQEVHLIEGTEPYLASQRVTQGADRWLDVVRHRDPTHCVQALRARGYAVYAAMMDGDTPPEALAHLPRVAIVFGSEHSGVSQVVESQCDGRYTIPMRGFSQSLNVSVAAALTLYAATRGRVGDLSDDERLALRARFIWLSVPEAHAIVAESLARGRRDAIDKRARS
jgi:tRNA (guanosine-2'-O-)-methyltransferase